MFVALLQSQPAFATFATSLPYTTVCLLLLGDRPSPSIAAEVLHLVELGMRYIPSFVRKFELASGWSTLKNVLPYAWAPIVQKIVFQVMVGYAAPEGHTVLACPQMIPIIFTVLQSELIALAGVSPPENLLFRGLSFGLSCCVTSDISTDVGPAQTAEALLEQLIELQSVNAAFREAFQSQATTQMYINAYRSFVVALSNARQIEQGTIRILEKMSHFALTLSLDLHVVTSQKEDVRHPPSKLEEY